MPLHQTKTRNTYAAPPDADGIFVPDYIAEFLRKCHALEETFALETVARHEGSKHFIRLPYRGSHIKPYLEAELGVSDIDLESDWLQSSQWEHVVVWTLTLSRHTALPIARYSTFEIEQRWQKALTYIAPRDDDPLNVKMGVRLLLQPAPPGWQDPFLKDAPKSGDGGDTSSNSRLWLAKANGPAFRAEIQLIAICGGTREQKRRAAEALDQARTLVAELAGDTEVWRRRTRRAESVEKLSRQRGTRIVTDYIVWPPLDFLSSNRDLRYVLSPEEAVPLWMAPLATPKPAPVDVVLSAQSDPEADKEPDPHAGPETYPEPLDELTVVGAHEPRQADQNDATGHVLATEPVFSNGHPAPKDHPEGGPETVNSFRPPGLSVRTTPDRRSMRNSRGRVKPADSDRSRDALANARPGVMGELGLSAVDLAIFDQLGDLPLGSRQDLAYAWGWGIGTVYKSVAVLKRQELVKSRVVHIDGRKEERYWIPEDRWDLIMDGRSLSHTENMLGRLWVNPEAVSAVYRLIGILTQGGRGRELVAFRWLWRRPFDAVFQCDNGWAACLWVGVWQDAQRLETRLRRCWDELGRWSGRGERSWPGRVFFVVPNAWVAERVWRAVRRERWEEYCATLNMGDDQVIGDLDLGESRGSVPIGIREEPPRLRADVGRLIDLLENDPGSRMRRQLNVVEMNPRIKSSLGGRLTGINGSHTGKGLDSLQARKLVHRSVDDGYVVDDWVLAMAARRDRVWLGLPGRRHGKKKLETFSGRHWKHVRDVQRVLGKFAASGCAVAPGWLARDHKFEPDGVAWLEGGPYGMGWYYLVDARSAKSESTVRSAVGRALNDKRTDRFPMLVICQDEMEELVWVLGAGRAMLTASATRIRSKPVVGQEENAWLRYGEKVPLLGSRARNRARKGTDADNDH